MVTDSENRKKDEVGRQLDTVFEVGKSFVKFQRNSYLSKLK